MKNYIAVIATIVFLICPPICFSSYLVELKNGSAFIINHYWKEGGQMKFYYYGGVVGIKKEFVREIRESDLPNIVEEPQPAKKEESQAKAEYKPESKQKKKTLLLPNPEKKVLLKEKMRITREIKAVSIALREAKAKNDRKQMQVKRKRLLFLQTELLKLREKVGTWTK